MRTDYSFLSSHLRAYEEELAAILAQPAQAERPPFPTPKAKVTRTCLICFVNRSGSSLLADALARTRSFGHPGEFLNPGPVAEARKTYGVRDLAGHIELCMARTVGRNGVFSLKVGVHQLASLAKSRLLWGLLPDPCFVYVTREDLVMQAVSLFIAWQTNAWTSRHAAAGEATYDFAGIAQQLRDITRTQAEFESFFSAHQVSPLRLTYEQISQDLGEAIRQVFAQAGLEPPAIGAYSGGLQQQRTERNREWAARFLAEFRPDLVDPARGAGPLRQRA